MQNYVFGGKSEAWNCSNQLLPASSPVAKYSLTDGWNYGINKQPKPQFQVIKMHLDQEELYFLTSWEKR